MKNQSVIILLFMSLEEQILYFLKLQQYYKAEDMTPLWSDAEHTITHLK